MGTVDIIQIISIIAGAITAIIAYIRHRISDAERDEIIKQNEELDYDRAYQLADVNYERIKNLKNEIKELRDEIRTSKQTSK